MSEAALVAVACAVGSLARVATARVTAGRPPDGGRRAGFPTGTLAVNLLGSLVLGLLTGLHGSPRVQLILGTALIGSFTTFSTWIADSDALVTAGARRVAAANLALSAGLGLLCVDAGRALGRLL